MCRRRHRVTELAGRLGVVIGEAAHTCERGRSIAVSAGSWELCRYVRVVVGAGSVRSCADVWELPWGPGRLVGWKLCKCVGDITESPGRQ